MGAASGAALGLLAGLAWTLAAQRYLAQGLHRLAAQTVLDWGMRGLFAGAIAGVLAGGAAAAWESEDRASRRASLLVLAASMLGALAGLELVASLHSLWIESRSEALALALTGLLGAAAMVFLLLRRSRRPRRAALLRCDRR